MKAFDFYLAPVRLGSQPTASLIAAFHRASGEPLTLQIPLLADSTLTSDFLKTLWQPEFKVFFLDELNREVFSCIAVTDSSSLSVELAQAKPIASTWVEPVLIAAQAWFANRTPLDDAAATQVNIIKPLMFLGMLRSTCFYSVRKSYFLSTHRHLPKTA